MLGLGLTVVAPSSAAVDTSTCQGRATTIVVAGGPGNQRGTPGDDVVVLDVPPPALVAFDALGGNDTICVIGGATGGITGGEGDDVVSTEATGIGDLTTVDLGAGNDTFVGGAASDYVVAGDGTDRILAGAGDDSVVMGTDIVDVGEGDDILLIKDGAPLEPVLGGPGADQLAVTSESTTGSVVAIDNVAGTVSVGGATGSYAGFEQYAVNLRGTASTGSFRGGEGAEAVLVGGTFGADDNTPVFTADLGGGDDLLKVDESIGGVWAGGAGRDTLRSERVERLPASRKPTVRIDLGKQRYRVQGQGRATVSAFEALEVLRYGSAKVVGSDGRDELTVQTCTAWVDGGNGRDVITFDPDQCGTYPRPFPKLSLTASGGAGRDTIAGGTGRDRLSGDGGADVLKGRGGDDLLRGGAGRDKLLGNTGRETAYGGGGRDTCRAETRVRCELR